MSLTTILFDLDGTLLPMDQEKFIENYFKRLCQYMAPHGYDPKKLVDTIWSGTEAVIRNTGSDSNETVFWRTAEKIYGEKILQDKALFDEFYKVDFDKVKEVCTPNPAALETVRSLAAAGYRVVLATNPIFPAVATEHRIRWTGLTPEDFVLCTTYENIHRAKPNPEYYRVIADRLHVRPEECLMVGNDVDDDMPARAVGMDVFLLTDCLINKSGTDISAFANGGFPQLQAYIQSHT